VRGIVSALLNVGTIRESFTADMLWEPMSVKG
jgi:hypothetical protein